MCVERGSNSKRIKGEKRDCVLKKNTTRNELQGFVVNRQMEMAGLNKCTIALAASRISPNTVARSMHDLDINLFPAVLYPERERDRKRNDDKEK